MKQLDDHLGRLFQLIEEQGSYDSTIIVFTSDHSDYLGDHGLEKKFCWTICENSFHHSQSNPESSCSRGSRSSELFKSIDLIPIIIESLGGTYPSQIHEGHSLKPLLHNETNKSEREKAIS